MIASTQEHRELERLRLALGLRQDVGYRPAESEIVRVARAELVEARAERGRLLDVENGARHLVHVLHEALRRQHDEAVLDALHDRFDDVDAHPLDRHRGLSRDRFDQVALLERPRCRSHRHGSRAPTTAPRTVLTGRCRNSPPPSVVVPRRRLAMLEYPRGGGALGFGDRDSGGWTARGTRRPDSGGAARRRMQDLRDVLDDDARQGIEPIALRSRA